MDHHFHTLSCPMGEGGLPQKGRERFSDLNAKPDTDSQLYLTILIYRSGLLNEYFELDAMNNPQVGCPRNKQNIFRFEQKQTETRSVSRLFRFVS